VIIGIHIYYLFYVSLLEYTFMRKRKQEKTVCWYHVGAIIF
jgi:hypothetical protein